jgi:general secretion pathway protein I
VKRSGLSSDMRRTRASSLRVRSSAGFVLIDALVSLVITSVVVGLLFEAVSQNLTAAERVADRYQAALFARSKLASLGISDTLVEGQAEGRFDPTFSWVLTVSKDEALNAGHEAAAISLVSVQLDVRWQRRSKKFQLTYRTRRLAPQKEASASGTRRVESDNLRGSG